MRAGWLRLDGLSALGGLSLRGRRYAPLTAELTEKGRCGRGEEQLARKSLSFDDATSDSR